MSAANHRLADFGVFPVKSRDVRQSARFGGLDPSSTAADRFRFCRP
jgi:hypothetical protein